MAEMTKEEKLEAKEKVKRVRELRCGVVKMLDELYKLSDTGYRSVDNACTAALEAICDHELMHN